MDILIFFATFAKKYKISFARMNRINSVLAFIGRHKYFFVIVFFLLLIVVLDDNCILIRMERRERMAQMKATIAQYQKEYEQDSKALNELNNQHQLEKLARERYHMKRDGEDLFIVVEPEEVIELEHDSLPAITNADASAQ